MLHICRKIEIIESLKYKTVYVVKEIRNNRIYSLHFNTEWFIGQPSHVKLSHYKLFNTKTKTPNSKYLAVGYPVFEQGYHCFETYEDALDCLNCYNTKGRNLVVFKATIPSTVKVLKQVRNDIPDEHPILVLQDDPVWISIDDNKTYTKSNMICAETLVLNERVENV